MDLSKYQKKGLVGLENLGNTCFLNTCMQVLSNTYELNALLDSANCANQMKTDIPESEILVEWNDLRKVMWSGNGIISPKRFVHNVQQIARKKDRELFTGFVQNDLPEFMQFFMECIHCSISRKVNMKISGAPMNPTDKLAIQCYNMLSTTYSNEYSEIMEMYYGIYMSEIISKSSNECYNVKPESYFILDLPIQDSNYVAKNLYDCFNLFTKPEILDGENAWFNENTGKKEDIKKQISFWNFPSILIITLKRFSPCGRRKMNVPIDYPLENLDLSSYVRGYNQSTYKYDLFGVCNHMGGVSGGHYTAFVRNADAKWIHYNDRNVELVEDPRQIVSPLAYCLIYRKKNNLL